MYCVSGYEDRVLKFKDFLKKAFTYFGYDFVKVTGIIPALIWMRPKVYHYGDKKSHNPKGGLLIISNHVSFIDPILLLCVFWKRRVFSLVTKDLYKNRLMTFILDMVHCIKVDKDNFSIKSFHQVVDKLKQNKAVLIFPEGQVNHENSSMLSFKLGAVLMAHNSGAKILPVYIDANEKRWENNIVVIGDPIDIGELCGNQPSMEELRKASDYIRERESQLEDYYINQIKKKKED